MKKLNNINKPNLLKRIFIKICRKIGFEIIDQSIFYVPTQNKYLGDNLSIPGKKSITIPLGQSKISRKVEALTIIFRSCTNVNMLTQNKKRLFEKKKSEYTFRSLNSIISSLKIARQNFSQVKFNILVVDHNSNKNDLNKIKEILNKSSFKNSIISLNVNEFKNDIKKLNAKNEKVTENQISNMSNINKSFLLAKNQCEDLIYFVEDDYLHQTNTINEMLFTYERLSSQTGNEIILCPSDYPFLYTKLENTKIFLGSTRHWRTVDETLCTFLTSTIMLKKHWEKFISMCKYEHYPFEQPLHDIYKEEYCLSPIPTLSVHFTNVNSIFGISPNTNWKKIWDENEV
jgi:hypothetical protein